MTQSTCSRHMLRFAALLVVLRGASTVRAATYRVGPGRTYTNLQAIAAIPGIAELNIGHAIVARALFSGLQEAVREMKRLMREASTR